jgi:hypothetical protein
MGRYVVILIAPLIIGALIAAGVVVLNAVRQRSIDNGLRRRRIEARRTLIEAKRQAAALPAADPAVTEESSHLPQARIAS